MPHVNLSKLDPKIQKQLYGLVPTAVPVPAKQAECPMKYAAVAGCPYDAVAEATKSTTGMTNMWTRSTCSFDLPTCLLDAPPGFAEAVSCEKASSAETEGVQSFPQEFSDRVYVFVDDSNTW